MKVAYTPKFIRMFKKLPNYLQEEVIAKIELFKNPKNHETLDVHKLHGKLKRQYGFAVDFHNRVTFEYISEDEVALLTVGDHEIYKQKH